ncbi:MSHA biogenesis protein MshI [Gilvimarinus sp. DA14]|uniref:MSHA biogenesis protein MshI n=1 Tax=Gilvimarinus sp. DA14 TaxID=2956798 RepID=UPI0020B7E395|nr:MSHA biogenesis protein MshI [Gilvimarinus sp. DA14]UTF61403.1 MSHA biogenesis protein MshI [Gilvimarinus sp. DA14]
MFRARKRHFEMVGIEVAAEGIAFVHVERVAGQLPRLLQADFLAAEPDQISARLCDCVAKYNLRGLPVTAVMAAPDYQLLLGDAPNVPAAELNSALRWKIKDLVSFPVADAVIDAFLLPESCSRGDERLAYVVAARRAPVAALVEQIKEADLNLSAIEIPELALARLLDQGVDTARPQGLVNLFPGGGSLMVVKAGELYLARNFKLNYRGGIFDELPSEPLLLELQRSMDYFERQMRQPPLSGLYFCGDNLTADKLTSDLREGIGVRSELLSLETVVTAETDVAERCQALCLRALGAALRQEGAS